MTTPTRFIRFNQRTLPTLPAHSPKPPAIAVDFSSLIYSPTFDRTGVSSEEVLGKKKQELLSHFRHVLHANLEALCLTNVSQDEDSVTEMLQRLQGCASLTELQVKARNSFNNKLYQLVQRNGSQSCYNLKDLCLRNITLRLQTWRWFCKALETNGTLEKLTLREITSSSCTVGRLWATLNIRVPSLGLDDRFCNEGKAVLAFRWKQQHENYVMYKTAGYSPSDLSLFPCFVYSGLGLKQDFKRFLALLLNSSILLRSSARQRILHLAFILSSQLVSFLKNLPCLAYQS